MAIDMENSICYNIYRKEKEVERMGNVKNVKIKEEDGRRWEQNIVEGAGMSIVCTHEYNDKGERLCTCGSGLPWDVCMNTGDWTWCG